MIMNVIRFRLENASRVLGAVEIKNVLHNIVAYDGSALLMFSAAAYTLATKTQLLDYCERQMRDHRRESRGNADVLAHVVGQHLAQRCELAQEDFDLAHAAYLLGLKRLGEIDDTCNRVCTTVC